jgi:hypothetical protein
MERNEIGVVDRFGRNFSAAARMSSTVIGAHAAVGDGQQCQQTIVAAG